MTIDSLPGLYEPFSALTHLVGAVVFMGLGVKLVRRARGDRARVLYFGVYVVCSVLLLTMSGVYHMLDEGTEERDVLGRLDYAAIFTLIAGTHTPVQGLFFRGVARWGPLVVMWAAAVTGIALFSVYYHELPRGLGIAVFILLGWVTGVSGLVVWRQFGTRELRLLLGGGVAYSVGAVLMGIEWPTLIPRVIGPHEVWHLAVLGAMVMHWRFLYGHAQFPTDGPVPARSDAVPRRSA